MLILLKSHNQLHASNQLLIFSFPLPCLTPDPLTAQTSFSSEDTAPTKAAASPALLCHSIQQLCSLPFHLTQRRTFRFFWSSNHGPFSYVFWSPSQWELAPPEICTWLCWNSEWIYANPTECFLASRKIKTMPGEGRDFFQNIFGFFPLSDISFRVLLWFYRKNQKQSDPNCSEVLWKKNIWSSQSSGPIALILTFSYSAISFFVTRWLELCTVSQTCTQRGPRYYCWFIWAGSA